MGYYTRVLSKRADCPSYDDLVRALAETYPRALLSIDKEEAGEWSCLQLTHAGGPLIAIIERCPVQKATLGEEEIAEFIEEIDEGEPSSAVPWLRAFLASVKTVYAFQHFRGTEQDDGYVALKGISDFIWRRGGAIMQADGEGFSNEEGYHILWQFSERVTGPWWMAVLHGREWLRFQMELGNPEHRRSFRNGQTPPGVPATAYRVE